MLDAPEAVGGMTVAEHRLAAAEDGRALRANTSRAPFARILISTACGFEDASYFVRFSKKYTGTTPRAFKLQGPLL